MKIIEAISTALSWLERSLIIILLGVMCTLAFLQVILRNVFSFGFLWADPLLRYMVLWVGFLGAVLATREGKHFAVDFLNRFLSPRMLLIVKSFVNCFAAVVSILLMRAAFQFLFEAFGGDEKDLFDLPRRMYFAIIPVGFGLIALQFTFNVIRHLHKLITRASEKPEADLSHLPI
jgi:TRAP-type C4-dicarboxylate transport system permease small subunit